MLSDVRCEKQFRVLNQNLLLLGLGLFRKPEKIGFSSKKIALSYFEYVFSVLQTKEFTGKCINNVNTVAAVITKRWQGGITGRLCVIFFLFK